MTPRPAMAHGASHDVLPKNTSATFQEVAMEQRDVIPPVDVAKEQSEPIARSVPVIEPRWLDIDTAAQYLCMTRHALYHQVARLQLPFVRHGRLLRFDRLALDRWFEKEVKYGFGEARRRLVPPQDDQRPGVSRVNRVRGQEGRRATRQRDRARHPRGRARLEGHDSELR